MKVSFSTLGCPGWSWEDILITAKELGFHGIEVRGVGNELHVPKAKPFHKDRIEKTKSRISEIGIELPCLTSSCFLFDRKEIDKNIEEAKDYIDTASELNCPYVRVLGDKTPEPKRDIDENLVAESLVELGNYSKGKNVKVLIETNGVYSNSEKMASLMESVNNSNVAVLWDVHHPFRFMNEPVKETYNRLKNYIEHVHVKDSVVESDIIRYKMMGYGDIPVKDAILMLKEDGYSGYISLEWVKRWCLDLEDPGIVFCHFIKYVKDIIE